MLSWLRWRIWHSRRDPPPRSPTGCESLNRSFEGEEASWRRHLQRYLKHLLCQDRYQSATPKRSKTPHQSYCYCYKHNCGSVRWLHWHPSPSFGDCGVSQVSAAARRVRPRLSFFALSLPPSQPLPLSAPALEQSSDGRGTPLARLQGRGYTDIVRRRRRSAHSANPRTECFEGIDCCYWWWWGQRPQWSWWCCHVKQYHCLLRC